MRVAILGGYGLMGQTLAARILKHTDFEVRLIGRNPAKVDQVARDLKATSGASRIDTALADAQNPDQLVEAYQACDWLVLCLDSSKQLPSVIEALLKAPLACLDVMITPDRLDIWQQRRDALREASVTVITEAGLQPGLPGVLYRWVQTQAPRSDSVQVSSVIKIQIPKDLPMPASVVDLLKGFTASPRSLLHGSSTLEWWAYLFPYRFVRFSKPFGWHAVATSHSRELEILAQSPPTPRRIRFSVAGFNSVATWIGLPLLIPFVALLGPRRFLAKILFYLIMKPFTRQPYGVAIRVDSHQRDGAPVSLEIQNPEEYVLTADILVATLEQHALDAPAPGVHLLAQSIDADRLLARLEQLGSVVSWPKPPAAMAPTAQE